MTAKTITSEEKILVIVQPLTLAGNPAEVDGDVITEVVGGDGTIEPVEGTGGRKYYAVSGTSESAITRYISRADKDLGPDATMIEEELVLTVIAPGAASLGVTFGDPEPK